VKITAEPRSDQWNADDFVGGPRVFTIAGVKAGTAEQKYDIELAEGQGRFWRPPLTMLRLLIAAWGDEAADWVGRRVELYRDETVRFGSDAVGGIRIKRMSHLPDGKTYSAMLTSTRGRRTRVSADPLPDGPALITQAEATEFEQRIAAAVTLEQLGAIGADLKSRHLGAFKDSLQSAWSSRSAAIKAEGSGQGGGNDQGDAAEPPSDSRVDDPPGDQTPPADTGELASPQQLARLRQCQSQEQYSDADWISWIRDSANVQATKESEITAAEAERVLAMYQ